MSSSLQSQLESLLFISPKPLTLKKLVEVTRYSLEDVALALEQLLQNTNTSQRGVRIILHDEKYMMTTSEDHRELVDRFVKDDLTSELTKPALETLTIIAYRGPITKAELELIRGVNCSLILRNLMMRGLVESKEDKKNMQTYFNVTLQFLRHLGLTQIFDLPEYETLRTNENIEKLLKTGEKELIMSDSSPDVSIQP